MVDENGLLARLFGPQRETRKMLALPGVWVSTEVLARDAMQPGSLPATCRLQYLRRVEPGAPLPDDVNPGAVRYEAMVHTEVSEKWRRPAAFAGAALTLGSAGLLAAAVPWGILSLLAGIALIVTGVTGGMECVTFRRSEAGAWVEAEAELPPAEPLPQFAPWERVLYGTLSTAFFALMLTERIEGNLLLVGTVGAGLAVAAVWDSLPIRRRDPNNELVADLRFRELANPARPLTPEDLGAIADGGGRPAFPEPRDEG